MTLKQVGNTNFVSLHKGQYVVEELVKCALHQHWTCGKLTGIGAVHNIELGIYDNEQKKYIKKQFPDTSELLSLQGNMSYVDNEPFFHLHVVLANSQYQCFGGHLFEAEVAVTAEIVVTTYPVLIERQMDDEIGLKLWDLQH